MQWNRAEGSFAPYIQQQMKEQGSWNPPLSNFRVNCVLDVFYHLNKRRDYDIPPMGGQVSYRYLADDKIKAYLDNNPSKGFGDREWLITLLYKADHEHLKEANKPKPKPSK